MASRLSAIGGDGRAQLSRLAESVTGIEAGRFQVLWMTGQLPPLSQQAYEKLSRLVSLREQGEPLQYLLGFADFYGRTFSVAPGVLIPRFDTEILVDTALSLVKEGDSVLDLCAGTGCVGLTVGAEKKVSVTEVEKFEEAFRLLKINAEKICPSAQLIQGDVFLDRVEGVYNLILSNPPYIPTKDLPLLSAEVRKEPVSALDGGDDGLGFYRTIVDRFSSNLRSGGYLLFECGIGQASAVEEILCSAGFSEPVRVSDYGGVPRVVGAKKSKGEELHV